MARPRQHHRPRPPARRRRQRGQGGQALESSRGGVSTEVHLVVDALGLPVAAELTESQRNDAAVAPAPIEQVKPLCLLGDKADDANAIGAQLEAPGATAAPSSSGVVGLVSYVVAVASLSAIAFTAATAWWVFRYAPPGGRAFRAYAAVALACALAGAGLWLWPG